MVGSAATTLVVIRGNSGSGKSSVARSLRAQAGRGVAWVEQDYLRRVLLRERDRPGGVAPGLIEQTVRFCLDHGYHVLLEGILAASSHSKMISGLLRAHRGRSFVFYLDVSFEETLRRHATRPQAAEFSGEDMRGWYLARDLLGVDGERVVPEHFTLARTVAFLRNTTGLLSSLASFDGPVDPDGVCR
ncbi:kinase [Frankia sp. R82]|uniref:kinase n=1 Tax=Frankia sp. R82 TaxID=2950553 RepID=UPI00255AF569